MIEFEHFKTCVRAFFPGHDFSWIRDCTRHFYMPMCPSDVEYVSCQFDILTPGEVADDEQSLVRCLKRFSAICVANPDTLDFRGDAYLSQVDADREPAIVLALNEISISTYARNAWTFDYRER